MAPTTNPSIFRLLRRTTLLAVLFTAYGVFLFTPAAATLQELQTGMELPEFSLKDPAGKPHTFAELRGEKLTIVLFWSTWDKKSEKALDRIQKLYQQYRERGLTVIAINADGQTISEEALTRIRSTVDRLKLTFPVIIDQGLVFFRDIGVIALPTMLVVDRERVIRYELSGYPLVGAENLADFVATTMEGKKPAIAGKKVYQPNKNALRLFNMGKNTQKSGRMADTAEQWVRKAIEADPHFVLPHLSLAKFYQKRGETAQARAQLQEALAMEPDNVIALCESALLLVNDGKIDEGKTILEKALKTDEAYTPCYYYAGFACGKQGKLDEARRMFDEAARLNPLDYNIEVFKARVFEEQNKQPEAAEAYRKALETVLAPN